VSNPLPHPEQGAEALRELEEIRNLVNLADHLVTRLRAAVPDEREWLRWRLRISERTLAELKRDLARVTDQATVFIISAQIELLSSKKTSKSA
jgi:hypothetical protein